MAKSGGVERERSLGQSINPRLTCLKGLLKSTFSVYGDGDGGKEGGKEGREWVVGCLRLDSWGWGLWLGMNE